MEATVQNIEEKLFVLNKNINRFHSKGGTIFELFLTKQLVAILFQSLLYICMATLRIINIV